MRRAAKRDLVEPAIVDALQKGGCLVYRNLPSDLLVHRRSWGDGWFRVMEAKSTKYADKRQKAQIKFLVETGVQRILTPEQALKDVGL